MIGGKTLAPCLYETWFIEDTKQHLKGLCPLCRSDIERRILLHGGSMDEALSNIYRMSREIRVRRAMAGGGYEANNWEVVNVMNMIGYMTNLAADGWAERAAVE